MPKDPQCADCPLHSGYQYPIRATRDESGSPGGWYCIGGEFVPEHEAPLVGHCDKFIGHAHGHEHQLDVALAQGEGGERRAVKWLAENVKPAVLEEALTKAVSKWDRYIDLHNAETRFEHSYRNEEMG